MSGPRITARRLPDGTMHIEAPGCIVNIQAGLRDEEGREVTNVSVNADGDRYAGEPAWWAELKDASLSRSGVGVRIIRDAVPA